MSAQGHLNRDYSWLIENSGPSWVAEVNLLAYKRPGSTLLIFLLHHHLHTWFIPLGPTNFIASHCFPVPLHQLLVRTHWADHSYCFLVLLYQLLVPTLRVDNSHYFPVPLYRLLVHAPRADSSHCFPVHFINCWFLPPGPTMSATAQGKARQAPHQHVGTRPQSLTTYIDSRFLVANITEEVLITIGSHGFEEHGLVWYPNPKHR